MDSPHPPLFASHRHAVRELEAGEVPRLQALFDAALARFKHPRRIVAVDALPRTALGKVQRAVLAAALAGGAP